MKAWVLDGEDERRSPSGCLDRCRSLRVIAAQMLLIAAQMPLLTLFLAAHCRSLPQFDPNTTHLRPMPLVGAGVGFRAAMLPTFLFA